jgi:hypothetical protein
MGVVGPCVFRGIGWVVRTRLSFVVKDRLL